MRAHLFPLTAVLCLTTVSVLQAQVILVEPELRAGPDP